MVGFSFAPAGWAFCEGQLLPITQNEALFNLIGTTYGGDGVNTFALPDLRSRMPVHQGTGGGTTYVLSQIGGVESVTLLSTQIPSHTHAAVCNPGSTSPSPSGAFWGGASGNAYSNAAPGPAMNALAVRQSGGSQPHDNMPPFLVVNFVIALLGVFPSQN